MSPTAEVLERVAASSDVAVHPAVERLTAESVGAAHALGLAVNTWTCDDPVRMQELMTWGVDGICTNAAGRCGPDPRRTVSLTTREHQSHRVGYMIELEAVDPAEAVAVELVRERVVVRDDEVIDVAPFDEIIARRDATSLKRRTETPQYRCDPEGAERQHDEPAIECRRR